MGCLITSSVESVVPELPSHWFFYFFFFFLSDSVWEVSPRVDHFDFFPCCFCEPQTGPCHTVSTEAPVNTCWVATARGFQYWNINLNSSLWEKRETRGRQTFLTLKNSIIIQRTKSFVKQSISAIACQHCYYRTGGKCWVEELYDNLKILQKVVLKNLVQAPIRSIMGLCNW